MTESLRRLLPTTEDYRGLSSGWRHDLLAGVTVGIVALPLALAFGITAGMGASAGIVTAIVAGFAAALFGGSNVQVSGPTGAMTVVLVPIVSRHGVDAVLVVGLVAGMLIIAAGVAGLGRFLAFVPWPVIEGFTLGIAVIIFLQQVPGALGTARPEGENTAVVAVRAAVRAGSSPTTWWAVAIVAGVVGTMALAQRLHRGLPASLIGVGAATLVTALADAPVPTIGTLPSSLPSPRLPHVDPGLISELSGAILAVAALAALESLLSAKVADGMAGSGRHDPNRELVGQGVANVLSPLFGGMPATGAIARTAVNVRAGARTRVAAMVHALLLVGVVFLGSSVVGRIPLAALAGVLMVTAVRMVEVHNVVAVLRSTRSDALILVVTALVTVAFDLILAVEIGMVTAGVLALRAVANSSVPVAAELPRIDAETAAALRADNIVSYRLDGALFFGAVQQFLTELTRLSEVAVVILRLPELQVLDATGAHAIGELIETLEGRGVTVLLKGPRPEHLRLLQAVGAVDRLAHERHVFVDLDEAIAHAREHALRNVAPAAATVRSAQEETGT